MRKDRNVTPGQMRFVLRFAETKALILTAFLAGAVVGWLVRGI